MNEIRSKMRRLKVDERKRSQSRDGKGKAAEAKTKTRSYKLDPELYTVARNKYTSVRRSRLTRCSSGFSKERLMQTPTDIFNNKCDVAERLLAIFRKYDEKMVQNYFASTDFGKDFLRLCSLVSDIFAKEDRLLRIQSPVYTFGDVHGNIDDLLYFADAVWPIGMDLAAGNFLFLGDYVDRGEFSLEVLAYLFSAKVLVPDKLLMIRGNHELRYVNGWEAHYKEKSFLWQCKNRFGEEFGTQIWEAVNNVFDCLPLAAIIDENIFCSHGGIPRHSIPIHERKSSFKDCRVANISQVSVPTRVVSSNTLNSNLANKNKKNVNNNCMDVETMLVMDLLWGDPSPKFYTKKLDAEGFGPGSRGGAAIMFGQQAVDDFLRINNFSYFIRAHQASPLGISISKESKVITIFSTSKDHGIGNACCGFLLIEDGRIVACNRLPEARKKLPEKLDYSTVKATSSRIRRVPVQSPLKTNPENSESLSPSAA